jgi:PAS domain S-box-containing protein
MPFATPALTQLTGLTQDSLQKNLNPLLNNLYQDDAKRLELKLLESARNLSPFRYTFRLNHPDRGEVWIESSALPQIEPNQSTLWHGFAQDITRKHHEETALRESEERYKRLSQTETDAIVMADITTGHLIDANDSAIQLYGYTRNELLQRTLFQLTQQQKDTRQMIDQRESRSGLVWHRKKDGSVFPAEMFLNYFHYQNREVYFVAIRDISERWQAEKALLRRASELQQRNNELARFNNVAVGRELRMIQLKTEVNQLLTAAGHPPRYSNEAAHVIASDNPKPQS